MRLYFELLKYISDQLFKKQSNENVCHLTYMYVFSVLNDMGQLPITFLIFLWHFQCKTWVPLFKSADPPVFTSLAKSPDTPVQEGNVVNLTCAVDSNPLPNSITWEKQGSSEALSSISTLTLSAVTRQQAGYYMCRANNGVPDSTSGSDVVSSPVSVRYSPATQTR